MRQLIQQLGFAKRAFKHDELNNDTPNVDAEWEKFAANHSEELKILDKGGYKPQFVLHLATHKIAASFIGAVLASGIAFAAILNPADSILLSGGISNESGYFAIPYEQSTVLARISHVGYKTVYRLCTAVNIGTIRLQPEVYAINGVQVKGDRQIVKAENGHLTYNMPQLLEILPADNAYEALTRIPGILRLAIRPQTADSHLSHRRIQRKENKGFIGALFGAFSTYEIGEGFASLFPWVRTKK